MTNKEAVEQNCEKICPDYFYRVHLYTREDCNDHLAFDFIDLNEATNFAKTAFIAADYCNVSIDFLENEVDTTQSPMIRDLCAPEYTYKNKSNQVYGKKINEFFTEGVSKEEELPFQ